MASLKNLFRFDPTLFYLSQSAFIINGTNDAMAVIFRAPKSGNIRYIGASLYSAPTGSPTFDCRLETVTADAPTPTGTLAGANGNGTWSPVATGFAWTQLTADVAVTAGTYYAAVVRGLSVDGSNNGNCVICWNLFPTIQPLALFQQDGGAWANGSYRPAVAVRYDDDTIPLGMAPMPLNGYTEINPASTPDEVAVLFTAGAAFDCVGAIIQMSFEASSCECDVVLYSGATAERTVAGFQADRMGFYSTPRAVYADFATPYTLSAGSSYRIAVKPTTGAHRVRQVDFPDVATRDAQFGEGQYSSRVDGGSWSETSTRVPMIIPIYNAITLPAGGGGCLPVLGGSLVR